MLCARVAVWSKNARTAHH